MKKKSLKGMVAALALTLTMGMAVTAYAVGNGNGANQNVNNGNSAVTQGAGMGRTTGKRGYDFVIDVLKDKANLTDEAINEALASGKTIYELAEENGISQEDFKDALLEERLEAVDEAVENETITEEEGKVIKETLETNMENCPGNFGQNCGQGRGFAANGNRGNGRGQGRGNGTGRGFNGSCIYNTANPASGN
jgi:hypothetical protein